jgi:hypothetical protein
LRVAQAWALKQLHRLHGVCAMKEHVFQFGHNRRQL